MAVTRKKPARSNTRQLLDDYHLLSYDELDSTNSEARRLAEGGASHGAFIWAKYQTQGRGRYTREWVSQDGNLFVSILLSPEKSMEEVPQISFLTCLAALESIAPLLPEPERLTCKWPNDLMLDGRKLGGILLESFETIEAAGPRRWVAVGLGMNITGCPDDLEFPASSLKDAGVEIVSAKIVLSRFIHHFIDCYNLWHEKGFAPIRKKWLTHCDGIGREVKVCLPHENIYGIFDALDTKGCLKLRLPDGKTRKIAAGDLYLL